MSVRTLSLRAASVRRFAASARRALLASACALTLMAPSLLAPQAARADLTNMQIVAFLLLRIHLTQVVADQAKTAYNFTPQQQAYSDPGIDDLIAQTYRDYNGVNNLYFGGGFNPNSVPSLGAQSDAYTANSLGSAAGGQAISKDSTPLPSLGFRDFPSFKGNSVPRRSGSSSLANGPVPMGDGDTNALFIEKGYDAKLKTYYAALGYKDHTTAIGYFDNAKYDHIVGYTLQDAPRSATVNGNKVVLLRTRDVISGSRSYQADTLIVLRNSDGTDGLLVRGIRYVDGAFAAQSLDVKPGLAQGVQVSLINDTKIVYHLSLTNQQYQAHAENNKGAQADVVFQKSGAGTMRFAINDFGIFAADWNNSGSGHARYNGRLMSFAKVSDFLKRTDINIQTACVFNGRWNGEWDATNNADYGAIRLTSDSGGNLTGTRYSQFGPSKSLTGEIDNTGQIVYQFHNSSGRLVTAQGYVFLQNTSGNHLAGSLTLRTSSGTIGSIDVDARK